MVAQALNVSLAQDSELERRIGIFFASQSRPALRAVEVMAADGVVTLRGQVHSYYEKQLSMHLAARVAGVLRLKDELFVQALRRTY